MGNLPADPQILLLTRENRLVNEAEVVAALAAEGCVEPVRSRTVVLERLRTEERTPTLVIADLCATLTDTDNLNGYREFLSAYHAASSHRPLALLILAPPPEEWPGGSCTGWASLITAYLTLRANEPVNLEFLTRLVRRIRQESLFTTAASEPAWR